MTADLQKIFYLKVLSMENTHFVLESKNRILNHSNILLLVSKITLPLDICMWIHHYSRYNLIYDIDIHFPCGHLSQCDKLEFCSCHFGKIFFLSCNYYVRDSKIGKYNRLKDFFWLAQRNYKVFNIWGHPLNQKKKKKN